MSGEAYIWKGTVARESRVMVKAPFEYKDRLKKLSDARFDGETKAWHVPWSAYAVPAIRNALIGLSIMADEDYRGLETAYDVLQDAQAWKDAEAAPNLPTRTKAWVHQRRAFGFAKSLRGCGLFLDMGGGKSLVAIGLVEELQPEVTVILCPKSVMGVWPKQFKIHAQHQYEVLVLDGAMTVLKKSERLAKWMARPNPVGRRRVVVVNYDAAWREPLSDMLLRYAPGLLILDESHKIKSPSGKASKFAARLGKAARETLWMHLVDGKMRGRVLLLTGTPMPHGPEDIYGQYRAADPSVFGTSFNRFKNKYMNQRTISNNGRTLDIIDAKKPLKESMADEFYSKLGSISFIVKRDEMGLDVPQRLPSQDRYADLERTTMKHYVSLEREFITELENGMYAVADNALTKLMRLRQLCSGFLKDIDGSTHQTGTEKQKLFADVLDDLPARQEPIIVFAAFHHDLDAIQAVATDQGLPYAELSGRRRDGLAEDSTLAIGTGVCGVQLQSGGVGIDFTRSRYGVYYSIDYNLGNIEQSFARLDRPGQQYPVAFIHLLTRFPNGNPTVDGITYQAIEERRDLVEATLEASRKERS